MVPSQRPGLAKVSKFLSELAFIPNVAEDVFPFISRGERGGGGGI